MKIAFARQRKIAENKMMREEFIESVKKYQDVFELNLTDEKIAALADYYETVGEHNEILHLVAPASAQTFAVRHILESLTLLEFLPLNAKFCDLGAGAGLPSLPCLLVREDLRVVLIESKPKKADFLTAATEKLNLKNRVSVVNQQFEEARTPNVSHFTCRALDKFAAKLPRILKWTGKANLLFFGGNNLREALREQNVKFSEKLMPLSEQRFLLIIEK